MNNISSSQLRRSLHHPARSKTFWLSSLSLILAVVFSSLGPLPIMGLTATPGQDADSEQRAASVYQAPILNDLAPASGPVPSIVTINGANFSFNSSENIVQVGSTMAPSRTLSTSQIQFIVPDGLPDGTVNVTVVSRGVATNALTFTITAPATPDVLTSLSYNLDFTSTSHAGATLRRGGLQARVVSGGDMIFPGALTAFRGLFPTPFFEGLGLPSFAVTTSVPRGSLYATPLPGRTGVVKDTPARDLPSTATPLSLVSATSEGLVVFISGSVNFFALPPEAAAPLFTPVFLPNPNFTTQSPADPSNLLLRVGAWIQTLDSFAQLGPGTPTITSLPSHAGMAIAPPVPERNPNFSITPNRIGSPQPFLDSTLVTTDNGVVRIGSSGASFIASPAPAGQPIGSPVQQSNPNFNPTYPTSGPAQGQPMPFLSTLLVPVANGLVKVEGSAANFIPVPTGAGRVIAEPSSRLNPSCNFAASASASLDEVRLFLSDILLVTENGLVDIDGATIGFTPVPAGAGRVISPVMTRLNPDFNPFFPVSTTGSSRPFLPTLLMTTTNGLVSITGGTATFTPVPTDAGQVTSPPVFTLNANFNPSFNPGNPSGSPLPFGREILIGTTNGVAVITDGATSFIPLPFGAGMPVGSPIPVTTLGAGTEILIPVTNGLVRISGGSPSFVQAPAGAGSILGAPFINSSGQIFLAATNGLVQVTGSTASLTVVPAQAGEVISLPIPDPNASSGNQFILTTTNGYVTISGNSANFSPLPGGAGENIAPRVFLTLLPVANQPPVANAGPDRTVNVGTSVTFDGSASFDPDGTIVSYFWNFGDGTTASGQLVSHAYNSAGVFTVTLTVTDNAGATASDTALITVTMVDTTPPLVTLQAPVGGETIPAGSTFLIRWVSSDNVGVVSQDILLAIDGVNFNTTIASNLSGSTQSFNWSVSTTLSTTTARIRVIARDGAGNVGQGDSGPFTVRDTQPPTVTIQAPVPGQVIAAGSTFLIRWISTDNVGVVSQDILFSSDGINFNSTIASGLSASATQFNWSVPTSFITTSGRIRIIARDAAGNAGQGEVGPITIRDAQPPTVTIQAPAGGETIPAGSTFLIRWISSDNVGVVSHDILLAVDGFNFNTTIASGLSGATQQFNWSVPPTLSASSARIRVIARDGSGNAGQGDSSSFMIRDTIAPSVNVTAPSSGQTINAGGNFTIRWNSSDNVGVVSQDILLSTDGGLNYQTAIASGLSGNQTQFLWSVPSNLATTQARVRVVARDAAGNVGQGDSGIFNIRDMQSPTVTVVAPSAGQIVSPGTVFTIAWNSSDNVGVTSHDILLSTNGGASYNTTIVSGLGGNQQSFNWTVPNLNTTQARIRVRAFDAAGNVGQDDTGNFTIRDNTPPTVNIIQPGAGQTISPGTTFTIQWSSSDNVGVTSQDIQFSSNGGQTFSTIASNLPGSQQQFNWNVPIINTPQAQIRILARDAAGNQGQDVTGNFTIRDTVPPTVNVTAPVAGQPVSPGSTLTIQWTSSDNIGVDSQDIQLSTNGGGSYSNIVTGLPGSQQQYNWSVPTNINTTQARIRVIARDAAGNVGQDDTGNFTIRDTVAPAVSLIAPVGGEVLPQGSQFTIRWNSSDNIGVTSHDVQLSTNGGSSFSTIASNLSGNAQSFNWTVPNNVSTNQAQIRVLAHDAAGNVGQATSGNFTIQDQTSPTVNVTRPSAGEVVNAGSQFTIRWTSSDNVAVTSQDILLSTDGGNTFPTTIASNLPGSQQSFNWNVPSNLSTTQAVVRVTARDAAGNTGQDDSGRFTIQQPPMPPTVRVIAPNGGETIMAGSTFTIRWMSSDNIGIVSHDIFLSTDGGQNYNITIQTGLPGTDQSFDWSVPSNLSTTRGRIRVVARDTDGLTGQDNSDGNFTIQGGGGGVGQLALVASGDLTILHRLPGSGAILGTIGVTGNAKEVAVAPNRQFAIALTAGNRVSVVTGLTGSSPQESASLDVGGNPVGVAISSDSSFAVVLVNTTPVRLVPILGLPNSPSVGSPFVLTQVQSGAQDIALSSLGTVVVTASSIGGIAIVDGYRASISPSFRGVQRTGTEPNGVAFSRDGSTAFVVNHGNDSVVPVTGLAPGGRPALGRIVTPGSLPRAIAISSDGSTAVVTNEGGNSATIYRVSGSALTQVITVNVGLLPGGVSISGDGESAIVSNTGDQTVTVITNLRGTPTASSTIGPSGQLATDDDREQSIAFVP
ncbi:MAG: PKD domain-containing protein [Acidobacteria bacterium]|nr:PKD domain-containing protein [Acidobacteriota bacterium]